MKKIFSFISNQVLTLSQYLILLLMLFWGCSSTKIISSKHLLIPVDTITCNYNIYKISSSYYSSEYKTQMNFYCRVQDGIWYFTLCKNSIFPTSSFPFLSQTFANFIVNDLTSFVYNSVEILEKNAYIKIDTNGKIINKIYANFGKAGEEPYLLYNLAFLHPTVQTEERKYFYTYLTLYTSWEYRFKHNRISEIYITEDSILSTNKHFGSWPAAFFDKDKPKLFSYEWQSAANKNNEVVSIFPYYTDSIYVSCFDRPDRSFPVKSKHHSKNQFDSTQYYDATYRNRFRCESFYYSDIIYDSFRENYYITTAIPIKYENHDGTFNIPDDKKWSIIVLDSTYNQIDEIDMPAELSRFDIFIIADGIAIKNKILTEKNNENSVYVIYKIKKR